jgi:hypothetical protein
MTARVSTLQHSRSLRKIDGSKSCAELLEVHLQYFWCGNDMSLCLDHEEGVGSFIHGEIIMQFIFSEEDEDFILYTFLFEAENREEMNNITRKIQFLNPDQIDQHCFLIGKKTSKAIFLMKRVQAVSLLLDEEIDQSLQVFISTARKIRSLVGSKQKKLSWLLFLVSKLKKKSS